MASSVIPENGWYIYGWKNPIKRSLMRVLMHKFLVRLGCNRSENYDGSLQDGFQTLVSNAVLRVHRWIQSAAEVLQVVRVSCHEVLPGSANWNIEWRLF
jgi:hypothetical protein